MALSLLVQPGPAAPTSSQSQCSQYSIPNIELLQPCLSLQETVLLPDYSQLLDLSTLGILWWLLGHRRTSSRDLEAVTWNIHPLLPFKLIPDLSTE